MKIEFNNSFKARSQMADIMTRLMKAGKTLPAAADFTKKFREALGHPDVVEMHVFTSVEDLASAKIEHLGLRQELRRNRIGVIKKIASDGFCLAFARQSQSSRSTQRRNAILATHA